MMRTRLLLALCLLPAACENGKPKAKDNSPPPLTPAKPAAAAPPPATVPVTDLGGGVTVSFNPDGSVQITGKAVWGDPLDARYESVDYFLKAVPVIERGLGPDQAKALRDLIASKTGQAAPPPADPTPGAGSRSLLGVPAGTEKPAGSAGAP